MKETNTMDSRAALGAAAAVALTVTGGVSALFLTVAQAAPETPAPNQAAVTVEYVDEYGNPVSAPGTVTPASAAPEIVLVSPDGSPAEAASAPEGYGAQQTAEYDEHEEDEEYEEYEDEAEYEHEEDEEYGDHEEDEEYEDD